MSTIDQQFVEYIVKTIVNNPDKVEVKRSVDERGVLLELAVDPEDVGRVIGRGGITAQSMRTLLRALGTKNDAHYNLKIVNDDEASRPARAKDDAAKPAADTAATEAGATSATETTETEVAAAPETPAEAEASNTAETFGDDDEEETEGSSIAERTRAELADLDDLDI